MDINVSLKDVIDKSFTQYSGAVIQSRALVDVRDFVKPSARQIYYCMFTDNFTHNKPFNKTLKAIGSAMRLYIHGDASCEGIIMRSGQPFSMRYPLVEVEGSYGNQTETSNWAAPRYTASRLSELTNYFLQETNKHTIEEWDDNYDDTEQYPRVFSSLGFYNIVNGTMGIATGIASSIPQFNLKEVNDALITLINNPDAAFEDIICYPDFATYGTILNKDEIFHSLKNGTGKGCLIQATIEYDKKEHALIVRDLPYGVYTNTVCNEITKLVEENDSIGIVNINDLTGEQVCIKIYLSKNADKDIITNFLYENTSLRKMYNINMTMLDQGRFPKVFGWKEALLAHLKHEKKTYINLYNYQLQQLNYKLKIVNSILKAIDNIEHVISIIKKSNSTSDANLNLCSFLEIDSEQAKAILDIKLSKLAHLESDNYIKEQTKLKDEIKHIQDILNDDNLFKQQMINRLNEVSQKFGDKRRTQVIQKNVVKTVKTSKSKEKIVSDVVLTFNPLGYVQNIPLASYKSNGFKAFKITTEDVIMLFSNKGKEYRIAPKDIKTCGVKDKGTALGAILKLDNDEKVIAAFDNNINEARPYLIFATADGKAKKSDKSTYIGNTRSLSGMNAIKSDAEIVAVEETNGCVVTLNTKRRTLSFMANDLRPSGKSSGGVKGINLDDNDSVESMVITAPENFKGKISKRGGKGTWL